MRRTSSIIRDGYDYHGDIPANPGKHGGLEFRYRPILPEEADEVYAKKTESVADFHTAMRETIASHVTAWSEWHDDKAVPITPDAVGRLPVFWELWNYMNERADAGTEDSLEADTKNLKAG